MVRRRAKANLHKNDLQGLPKRSRISGHTVKLTPVSDRKFDEDVGTSSESDEHASDVGDVSVSAYQALLGSLSAKGGIFANAFLQREKEEEGVSSSSEEEDESIEDDKDDKGDDEHIEGDKGDDESNGDDEDKNTEGDMSHDHSCDFENHSNQVGVASETRNPQEVFNSEDEAVARIMADVGSDKDSEDDITRLAMKDSSNSFKKHLEHNLTDQEVALLSKGAVKFKCEATAAGVQKGKWMTTASDLPMEEKDLQTCGVKMRLRKAWLSYHKDLLVGDFQTHRQCQFFNYCNSYSDILFSKRPAFHIDGDGPDLEILDAYLLHVLNHVFKTRDLVTKNNEKKGSDLKIEEVPRDQGYTRPKVLILLPIRSSALRVVKRLLDLTPPICKGTVEHKARFFEEFGVEDEGSNEDGEPSGVTRSSKPADFSALFGANNDDHFRIGLKFTRKTVKLYSDFYSSDVIIASPLGLITRIGEAEQDKGKDVDFLSSIEILVIDYADVILMQNWSHVTEIGEQLNQIPTQQHGTDFMRIRELFLNGHGRFYRQTIILSSFADAGINAFFHRLCLNYAGKLKLRCEDNGVLSKVLLQVRQVYERVNCASVTDVDEARFKLFTKQVFGPLKESLQGGILIFLSSYFDFVRLRNFLKAENMSFCLLGEYTKQSDISRARAWFFHGRRQIMLYTERAHFYHRYKIRGIKELIFYSLPENAEFYSEITNMMEGVENPSSIVLFSQFDNLKLERVVGTSRATKMLKSENKTFMFC